MDTTGIDKFHRPCFCRHLYMEMNVGSMKIPPEFLKKHIKEEVPDTSTLKSPTGGSWPVKAHKTTKGVYLVEGWEQFRLDNSLVSGAFLVFYYCGNWCFDVEIFRLNGTEMEIPYGEEEIKAVSSDVCNDPMGKSRRSKSGVPKTKGNRVSWKRPQHVEFFLDKCMEESASRRTEGGNLRRRSWEKIQLAFKEEKGIDITIVQLENHWHFLKRKYEMCSEIVAQARRDSQYDSGANKVSWDKKQWEEYVQIHPDARMFSDKLLEHLAKMKTLFESSKHETVKNVFRVKNNGKRCHEDFRASE